jgi:hypothetical protein
VRVTAFVCGVLVVPLFLGIVALLHIARWADD